MGRKRSKNKLQTLFESEFAVSFFHKPNYVGDDVFYYIILDNRVKLRFKLINNTIVIDEIIQLSMTDQSALYNKLGDLLCSQTTYSVLVSLLGDTMVFHSVCGRISGEIVEDEQYITVSKAYYNRARVYYKNDKSKYGFYLLAVSDEEDELPQTEDQIEYDVPDPNLSNAIMSDNAYTDILSYVKDHKGTVRTNADDVDSCTLRYISFTVCNAGGYMCVGKISTRSQYGPEVDNELMTFIKFLIEKSTIASIRLVGISDRQVIQLLDMMDINSSIESNQFGSNYVLS